MRKFPDVGDGDFSRWWNTDDISGTGPSVGAVLHLDRSGQQSVGAADTSSSSLQETLGGLEERDLLQEPHALNQRPTLTRHTVPTNGTGILRQAR